MGTAEVILTVSGWLFTVPAVILAVYAACTGHFPTLTIVKTINNVYKDENIRDTAVPCSSLGAIKDLEHGIPKENAPPDVVNTANSPFTKEIPEEDNDPLAGLLGAAHELFSGGDRIEPAGN